MPDAGFLQVPRKKIPLTIKSASSNFGKMALGALGISQANA